MTTETFNNIIKNISRLKHVQAILLVGSRSYKFTSDKSDYDIHVILETDIPTFTLHYQKPMHIDITCYFIDKINNLHIDRKLEIIEADILYQKNHKIEYKKRVNIYNNKESEYNWIRFHLRHLKEDMLKTNNIDEIYVHRIRYLYHACKYRYILKNGKFRRFKRINWSTKDYQQFTRCFKGLMEDNPVFIDLVNSFIGKDQLKKLDFMPDEYEIETAEEFNSVKKSQIVKTLDLLINKSK